MGRLVLAVMSILTLAFAAVNNADAAAACRDSHGRFITCKPAVVERCRDVHGRFITCKTKVKPAVVAVRAPVTTTKCRDAKGRLIVCKTKLY